MATRRTRRHRQGQRSLSTLPATGVDTYWNFILPIPLTENRWVKGVEIRPGDKRLIHHANVVVDRLELSRTLEKTPGAGYGGMEVKVESQLFGPNSSHFLFWKPGTVPYFEPDDMALRMDKGTDLVLKTHLQPSGKPETHPAEHWNLFHEQAGHQASDVVSAELRFRARYSSRRRELCRDR